MTESKTAEEVANLKSDITALVNSHEALKSALRTVLKRHCGCQSSTEADWHSDTCYVPAVRQALALAEGE